MQKFFRVVLPSPLTVAVFLFAGAIGNGVPAQDSGGNPHELSSLANNTVCTTCHRQSPDRVPAKHTRAVLPEPDYFSIGSTAMCVPCHEGSVGSHPLDVYPEYTVPADLPLSTAGGITCLTCHYAHGSLRSDHPCCSVSFLDRMLGSDRMTKSFLLRRNNKNGGLCKACHESY